MFATVMNARAFANWLAPIAWLVLVGGWIIAVIAFLAIGTETCTTVAVPLGGQVKACTDTTSSSVILFTVIGFAATLGSVFLFALRYMLLAMESIAENTRQRNR